MKNILTITITGILVLTLFSLPVIALSSEDMLSRFASQSVSYPINDRVTAYKNPADPVFPESLFHLASRSELIPPDNPVSDSVGSDIKEITMPSLSPPSNPTKISLTKNLTDMAFRGLDDKIRNRTTFFDNDSIGTSHALFVNLTRIRDSSCYGPGWSYPKEMISEEEAKNVALSRMQVGYSCPVQMSVTEARLGSSVPAYATKNPCWYITINGYFTNPAECSCCFGFMDNNGNIVGYGCNPVGGLVVIDAVNGEVQMVSHYL
jgi:hypothetical protein